MIDCHGDLNSDVYLLECPVLQQFLEIYKHLSSLVGCCPENSASGCSIGCPPVYAVET